MSADLDVIRRDNELVAFISRYIELKKNGSEYRGLCPFHEDHNPSLTVSPAKQLWACFSCGAHEDGADVFGFLMQYEHCTFPEAIEKLGNGHALPDAKPIIRPVLKKAPRRRTFPHPAGELPDMEHRDLGVPVKVWTVRTADGVPYFYEARYLTSIGGKETRFWTFGNYSDQDPPRWECRHPANPRPFYGLEGLAKRPGAQVMIHEAPKKAEAAAALFPKLLHLALIGGAYQVGNMDVAPLAGRRCILLPDNDEAGRQAMKRLAARLLDGGAEEVNGIDPDTQPDGSTTPEGWDVADSTDWTPQIALAWAKERKRNYKDDEAPAVPGTVTATPSCEATSPPDASPPTLTLADPPIAPPRPPTLAVVDGNTVRRPRGQEIEPEADQLPAFSEFALAQGFADGPGQDWRYTAAWQTWAKWDGIRWVPDEVRAITWEVKNCCTAAMRMHVSESTPAQRMKLTTLKTVNAVAGLAGSDPRLAAAASSWDADPMLLGTPGGIVDLRTGAVVPSAREQMISKSTSVAPAAGDHPWWDKVIARAQCGPDFLQLWCGYLLTGDTREERFLFIHGPGAAGKSKFLTPLSEIMGDYRRTAKIDSFTARDRSEHSEEIARLAGARLVTATETEEGSRWNESRITALTGRDAIAARHMHKSTFEFKPQFKLVFIGNHRPGLRSVGEEMRRRIDLIEWEGTIPEGERILDLPDKLRAEYPAILAWMIEGCIKWQQSGLGKPAQVEADTREYLSLEDTLGAWLDDCAELKAGERTQSGEAYRSFKRWAEAAGEYVPSQKRFTQRLRDRGIEVVKSGARYFQGLRLKLSDPDDYVPESAAWAPPDK